MDLKSLKIAVFGLGHMGLPTAALLANNGFDVVGVARNPAKLEKINEGKSPILEPGLEELVKAAVDNKKFKATNNGIMACETSNVIMVIVPTPADENKNSDLSAVIDVCETISKCLKKNDLVIVESTVPPGTCDNLIIPLLEESGLKAGDDFKIAFSPERAIPNNTIYEMTHNSRVIGGFDSESTELAAKIYSKITEGKIIKFNDLISAETVKLVENTFRDLNIALANEIAIICETLGMDAIDVIKAANHHPRVNVHTPGPGVGGHCLPIDPYFLVEIADLNGLEASLIKMARDVNEAMPGHVVTLIEMALKEAGKSIEGSKIGILGFAYKGNVDDIRESPTIPLISQLEDKRAVVSVNDPFVSRDVIEASGYNFNSMDEIFDSDCVVLLTDHDQYKEITPEMIKNRVFVCTRPIIDPRRFREKGIIFKGIGRI